MYMKKPFLIYMYVSRKSRFAGHHLDQFVKSGNFLIKIIFINILSIMILIILSCECFFPFNL